MKLMSTLWCLLFIGMTFATKDKKISANSRDIELHTDDGQVVTVPLFDGDSDDTRSKRLTSLASFKLGLVPEMLEITGTSINIGIPELLLILMTPIAPKYVVYDYFPLRSECGVSVLKGNFSLNMGISLMHHETEEDLKQRIYSADTLCKILSLSYCTRYLLTGKCKDLRDCPRLAWNMSWQEDPTATKPTIVTLISNPYEVAELWRFASQNPNADLEEVSRFVKKLRGY